MKLLADRRERRVTRENMARQVWETTTARRTDKIFIQPKKHFNNELSREKNTTAY
jgi:hypothetical protein